MTFADVVDVVRNIPYGSEEFKTLYRLLRSIENYHDARVASADALRQIEDIVRKHTSDYNADAAVAAVFDRVQYMKDGCPTDMKFGRYTYGSYCRGGIIALIREYRLHMQVGLAESKQMVEEALNKHMTSIRENK